MNVEDPLKRFEELDAGRVLGDLDAMELAEWTALSTRHGLEGDTGLDLMAAEMECAYHGKNPVGLPPGLSARLKRDIPSGRNRVISGSWPGWAGWAVAACLLGLLAVREFLPNKTRDVRRDRSELLEKAPDILRLPLKGSGVYAAAGGEVIWSDSRQQGYLSLSSIPANDPARNQYQLWIVDPARDEFPVDGGVFDVPAGPGPVVLPIDAKLAVKKPAAFVITLERSGGVVRSKQETVVALAKS